MNPYKPSSFRFTKPIKLDGREPKSQNVHWILIRRILADAFLRSRMVENQTDLEELLNETVRKVDGAYHVQDRLLTEKEVENRWPFLDVVRLRNYRYKHVGPKYIKLGKSKNSRVYYKVADIEAWMVDNYQLEPFIELS